MHNSDNNFSFDQSKLLPQEEMLEIAKKKKKLIIGVPKEQTIEENRIALTPHAVELLVENGHEVMIEKNAGIAARFEDIEYSEVGAQVTETHKEIFQCDIIIKVAPFSIDEIEALKGGQVVISSLQIATQEREYFKKLQEKKVTAIAFEYLKDSKNNIFPVIQSMSEIAGRASIMIAAEYLSNAYDSKGELIGGISGVSPTEVVILGAGTAGEFAARTALGLGAMVKVFDLSVYKLSHLQTRLGQRIFTSILQPRVLRKAMKTADVVIGAMHMGEKGSTFVVSEEIIKNMKNRSVIVDIGIDHGGCFETSRLTTHKKPVFKKHGVIHYCIPNIASKVARTASYALSNIFGILLLNLGEAGGIKQYLKANYGVRNGVYIYKGIPTNEMIGNKFGFPSKDIDLLMAAF